MVIFANIYTLLNKYGSLKSSLVQLDTGEKIKVIDFIAICEVKIQDHVTKINLNIFPLGSYDMIISMDWLERYKVVLNCFDKTLSYVVEDQIVRRIKGISKLVSLRQISIIQIKKCLIKGCKLYAVHVTDLLLNEEQTQVKDHPVLNELLDVFPGEIPGLPPQGEIDFSIALYSGLHRVAA